MKRSSLRQTVADMLQAQEQIARLLRMRRGYAAWMLLAEINHALAVQRGELNRCQKHLRAFDIAANDNNIAA